MSLDFAFQLHACMDEYIDAVCLSSSAAATPIQFVLLLLPGNLLLEERLSWGEKKRAREFDNVFEGAILALFHHHVHRRCYHL